ncbi:MAG TPA: hypothetical protein VD993_13210 [Chitinophagaceae bacterium]|nr:hypothetical protein [Chitinophagaceae bacterium]
MNTESINTLKIIRETLNEVQIKLNDDTLTNKERGMLEGTINRLLEMENIIIVDELQAMVDKLNSSNDELKALIAKMEESVQRLGEIAATIKRVSDIVGTLVDITTKAMSAGIL